MVRVYLGHGAWGSSSAMAPWVDGLLVRGIEAHAVTLPRGHADRAAAAFLAQVPDEAGVVIGGQSYGGRAASMLAANDGAGDTARSHPFAGLICLSYPLYRPGRPEAASERTAHWQQIGVPVLLLSGERDPFARLSMLQEATALIPDRQLVTWPRIGHSLAPVRDAALDLMAVFLRGLEDR